jgi:hypothetical protein
MRKHIEPFVDRDVSFKRLELKGIPSGYNYKMLSIDEDSGACTMSVQWDAGYKQPPSVSYSDVEIFIMDGEMKVGDKMWRKGGYFFVPRGVSLPAFSIEKGCFALVMYNDTEPHIIESDEDMDGAEREGLIQLATYEDMGWQVPTLFPQTASGCLLKLLHFDEKTHAMTFLYTMTPGFQQDNISYHDCAEEAYHVWGTSWMMQFGDLPTGGYFWRPAYVNHGAFYSEHGILGFGRTDGELHNHFHHNAYSTPAENADRAAARLIRQKPELNKWMWTKDHNHFDFEYGENYTADSEDERVHIHNEMHKMGVAHSHDEHGHHHHGKS